MTLHDGDQPLQDRCAFLAWCGSAFAISSRISWTGHQPQLSRRGTGGEVPRSREAPEKISALFLRFSPLVGLFVCAAQFFLALGPQTGTVAGRGVRQFANSRIGAP
jgi:hypothetical protein